MKRLTLLIVLLVALGVASGFAVAVTPSFALSGSATLSWGIDLDSNTTGFYNEASGDLVVTLLPKDGTDTHAGTGDGFYGSITISNVELYWTDTAVTGGVVAGDIAAKIVGMGGKLAMGIYAAPDLALNFVSAIEGDSDAADPIVDNEGNGVNVDYGQYGTYLSYAVSDAISFGLEVVSADKWGLNTANAYAVALDSVLKFGPATVNLGVNQGFNYAANPLGVGAKVALDLGAFDPYVAFDGSLSPAPVAYDVGGGFTFTFLETVTATASVVYGAAFDGLDLKFVLTEPEAKGLVDGLSATLTAYVLNVGGTAPTGLKYEVIASGGYKVALSDATYVKPYGSFTYGSRADTSVTTMKATAGIEAGLIPLTVFKLAYTSGELSGTPVKGTIVASAKVSY